MNEDISVYLSGAKLYGDDFSIDEIRAWFADEAEGYATLGAKERREYRYAYHELNILHGFRHLPRRMFNEVLGIGSAYGDEFRPIADAIGNIIIVEPSNAFADVHEVLGASCRYVKPVAEGDLPFDRDRFDLITSLGVMHHIPNVTHVMSECHRCLSSGGVMLLREPIVSMGDWTKPRQGLTKRERGIPLSVLRDIILRVGFKVMHESLCVFRPLPVLAQKLGVAAFNSRVLTLADKLLSGAFSWNMKYHKDARL